MTRPIQVCETCGRLNRSRPLRAHTGSWRCRDAVAEARLAEDGFVSVGYLNANLRADIQRHLGPARSQEWLREGPRFVSEEAQFCGGTANPKRARSLWVKRWLAIILVCHGWDLRTVAAGVLSVLFQDARLATELGYVYALGHRDAALAFLEAEVMPRVRR